MSKDTMILSYLKAGRAVTPAFASRRVGCAVLHSAISRLRKLGHKIDCTMKARGRNRWGSYTLRRR